MAKSKGVKKSINTKSNETKSAKKVKVGKLTKPNRYDN